MIEWYEFIINITYLCWDDVLESCIYAVPFKIAYNL